MQSTGLQPTANLRPTSLGLPLRKGCPSVSTTGGFAYGNFSRSARDILPERSRLTSHAAQHPHLGDYPAIHSSLQSVRAGLKSAAIRALTKTKVEFRVTRPSGSVERFFVIRVSLFDNLVRCVPISQAEDPPGMCSVPTSTSQVPSHPANCALSSAGNSSLAAILSLPGSIASTIRALSLARLGGPPAERGRVR
jgi:hypothetical protein